MTLSLEERLRKSDGDYEKAEANTYRDLDDGTYQCQLKAKIYENKKKDVLKLQWSWRCIAGEDKGGTVTEFTPLEGSGLSVTKSRLAQVGVSLKSLSEILKYMPVLENLIAFIEIKTTMSPKPGGGEYVNRNIFIKKVISSNEKTDKARAEDTKGPEDKAEENPVELPETSAKEDIEEAVETLDKEYKEKMAEEPKTKKKKKPEPKVEEPVEDDDDGWGV